MTRYPGRRLFTALPPEAAHRLAVRLLALPMPWRRIGGDAPEDPRLGIDLAGIALANPIGLAAGFDKSCAHLDHLGALGFGYVVGGTITHEARRGHPKPRIARRRAELALVNAMGMPNDGAAPAARNLARGRSTAPRLVSIADEDPLHALGALDEVEPHADGFELNASSPNATWEHDAPRILQLLERMRGRTSKPVFLKLPPFEEGVERDAVLALAVEADRRGVSGLTCANTRPVAAADLAVGRGGLSGRPLFARTPAIVREVRAATRADLPINASGGIFSAEDALACIEAGATSVQIYTGMIYEGPGIVGDLARGLLAWLTQHDTDMRKLAAVPRRDG